MRCLHRNPRDKDICSDYFQSVVRHPTPSLHSLAAAKEDETDTAVERTGIAKRLGYFKYRRGCWCTIPLILSQMTEQKEAKLKAKRLKAEKQL